MKELPFVSVIIPTFNEAGRIERCLTSLSNQDYPRDKYEIIIVDGYSTDSTVECASRFCARILYERKRTRAAACNVAMRVMRGEIAAFTDGDCEVEPSWLSSLIKNYDHQSIGGVGGPNTVAPQTNLSFIVFSALSTLLGFGRFRYVATYEHRREVYHNPGCNSSARRKVAFEVGLMNENLVSAEDVELSEKIREAGYKLLYTPDARLRHYWDFTLRSFFNWMRRYGIGQAQLLRLRRFRLTENARFLIFLFPAAAILATTVLCTFAFIYPPLWGVLAMVIGAYCVYAVLCGIEAVIRSQRQAIHQEPSHPLRFMLEIAGVLAIGQLAWGLGTIQGLVTRNK